MSSRRIAAILAIATAVAVAAAAPVGAHPSDFNTLTIDLLISDESIVIDAAMVQATYEPFPTTEEKQIVAAGVLDALGLAGADVDIDAVSSDRYHDVGFTVSGLESVTDAGSSIRITTTGMQAITGDLGLERLKLSVCRTGGRLSVTASRPSRPRAGQERAGCETWDLAPDDEALNITLAIEDLPATGTVASKTVIVALLVLGAGLAAVAVSGRRIDGQWFRLGA